MGSRKPGEPGLSTALRTLKLLGEQPIEVSEEHLLNAMRLLPDYYLETDQAVEMKGVAGAPDWFAYELRLWEFSELIRRYLTRNRSVRGRRPIIDAIAQIVLDKKYGKGRQNLVLILAQFGGQEYTAVLAGLLDDLDVYGHAIKGLTRTRDSSCVAKIKSILSDSEVSWIRTAARGYLKNVQ